MFHWQALIKEIILEMSQGFGNQTWNGQKNQPGQNTGHMTHTVNNNNSRKYGDSISFEGNIGTIGTIGGTNNQSTIQIGTATAVNPPTGIQCLLFQVVFRGLS